MTLILLDALLPIFVGLLLGYIAGRRGVMDNLDARNLSVGAFSMLVFTKYL